MTERKAFNEANKILNNGDKAQNQIFDVNELRANHYPWP